MAGGNGKLPHLNVVLWVEGFPVGGLYGALRQALIDCNIPELGNGSTHVWYVGGDYGLLEPEDEREILSGPYVLILEKGCQPVPPEEVLAQCAACGSPMLWVEKRDSRVWVTSYAGDKVCTFLQKQDLRRGERAGRWRGDGYDMGLSPTLLSELVPV